MGNQLWMSRAKGPSTAAASYWCPIVGVNYDATIQATDVAFGRVTANGGTLKSMAVRAVTAPGGAASWRVQMVVDGTPSTVLDLTMTGATASGTVTGDVAVVAGQKVSLVSTPSGTPAASDLFVTVEYQPSTADYFLYPGCYANGTNVSTAATQFCALFGSAGNNSAGPNRVVTIIPFAGTLEEIYLQQTVACGAGKSRDWWVMDGTTNTIVAGPYTLSGASDTTINVSGLGIAVTAGQRLAWKTTPTGIPAGTLANFGVVVKPTTTGLYALNLMVDEAVVNLTGNNFLSPVIDGLIGTPWTGTEAAWQMPVHKATTVTAMYWSGDNVNTGAETLDLTLRKDGASTTVTCQQNAGTAGSTSDLAHTAAFEVGTLMSYLITSAGSDGDWGTSMAVSLAAFDATGGPGGGDGGPTGRVAADERYQYSYGYGR